MTGPSSAESRTVSDSTRETWSIAIDYIVSRKRVEEALGFLAAVSQELAATLDYEVALGRVNEYVVGYLADWFRVDAVGADGAPRMVVSGRDHRVDAERACGFETFLYPPGPGAAHGVPRVLADATPVLYSERRLVARGTPEDAETLRAMLACGVRSAIVVPMMARAQLLGVVALAVGTQNPRVYGAADLALAGELTLRVASAVEIAQLHERLRPEARLAG
jgi:GAF domain-containing protein